MKEVWTGLAELLTAPSEGGNTRCYTNVFAWAEGLRDFAETVALQLEVEGISVVEIENPHPVTLDEEFPEETAPFLAWIRDNPGGFTTTDRHYYPSKTA